MIHGYLDIFNHSSTFMDIIAIEIVFMVRVKVFFDPVH